MMWVVIFAIITAVILLLPLLILCYATVILGGGYSEEQWQIANSMALVGLFLELSLGAIAINLVN